MGQVEKGEGGRSREESLSNMGQEEKGGRVSKTLSRMGHEENGKKGEQGRNPGREREKKKREGRVSSGRILEQHGARRKGEDG